MTTVAGTSLWAAFEVDQINGETRLARSLRTLASFIDRHPELDAATVTVWGESGSVDVSLSNTKLGLADRAEAVTLLADALDKSVEVTTYDDGMVLMNASRRVSSDRRVHVHAQIAKPNEWPDADDQSSPDLLADVAAVLGTAPRMPMRDVMKQLAERDARYRGMTHAAFGSALRNAGAPVFRTGGLMHVHGLRIRAALDARTAVVPQ